MTTKDDTGDKLVASIRRSKASGAANSGNESAANAAPRARSASKGDAATAAVQITAVTRQAASGDDYQSPGRIWPD